jgi:hypothetical protein
MVYPYDALNHKLLTSGFTLDKVPDHGKESRLATEFGLNHLPKAKKNQIDALGEKPMKRTCHCRMLGELSKSLLFVPNH